MVSQPQEEYDAEIREWAKRQAEWDKPGWDVWGTRWEWRRRKTTPFARPTGQRQAATRGCSGLQTGKTLVAC